MTITNGREVSVGKRKSVGIRKGDELRTSVNISSATFEAAIPRALENWDCCPHWTR